MGKYIVTADVLSATGTQTWEVEADNEARFRTNQAAWIYMQHEMFLKETLRRLINPDYDPQADGFKDHELFIKRCKARGVRTELLKFDVWEIRATRAIGLGSVNQAKRDTQSLLGLAGGLDERGRRNAIRDWIEVRFGYEMVDRYSPIEDRNQIETTAHTIATLESNDFSEGKGVPVGTDDPHVIHASIHVQAMIGTLQRFAQGQLPADVVFAELQTALPHTAKHVELIKRDNLRKGKAAEFEQALQQIMQQAQEVRAQMERLAKQRQAQQEAQQKALVEQVREQENREFQLKLRQVDLNHQVEMSKAESLNDTRMAKLNTSIQALIRKTIADERRKDFAAQSEQNRKNAESASNRTQPTGGDDSE